MQKFLSLALIFITSIIHAENKILAQYDARCDEKKEVFVNKNKILISKRYKIISVVKIDKYQYAYILDRNFSPQKVKQCPYSDPTIHSYIFVIQDGRKIPVVNEKILSNLNHISYIAIESKAGGFSFVAIYGQNTTAKTIMKFDIIKNKGIFLREVIFQKIVPDGLDNKKTIQNLPIEQRYELSNLELSNFI